MEKPNDSYTTRFERTLRATTLAGALLAMTGCGGGYTPPPPPEYDATDEGEMTEAEVKSLMGGAQRSNYIDGPGEESVFTLEGIDALAQNVSYSGGGNLWSVIDLNNEVNTPDDGLNAVEYWNLGQNAYRAACRGPDRYHVAKLNRNRPNANNFYSAVVARNNP